MSKQKNPALSKPNLFHVIARWSLQSLIWGLVLAMILVLEGKSFIGALVVNSGDELAAKLAGAISLICALLAFIANGLAGHFKDDMRPNIAQRAKAARTVAFVFLAVPTFFLANAFSWDQMQREWRAYTASPAYADDVRIMNDPMADRYERMEARNRLREPTTPNPGAEFIAAALLQLMLIWAADALRVPAKITEAEVRHWRKVDAARRGAITRARNKRQREEKQRREGKLLEKAERSGTVIWPFGRKHG